MRVCDAGLSRIGNQGFSACFGHACIVRDDRLSQLAVKPDDDLFPDLLTTPVETFAGFKVGKRVCAESRTASQVLAVLRRALNPMKSSDAQLRYDPAAAEAAAASAGDNTIDSKRQYVVFASQLALVFLLINELGIAVYQPAKTFPTIRSSIKRAN
jgi:hypothetical protein